MAATAINRDWSSAGNRLKWTYSAWVKRSGLGGDHDFFSAYVDAQNFCEIKFQSTDQLQFQNKTGNNWTAELKTNRQFRDTNAWYHIVAVWDTANATSGNRVRLYVNGVEETSFGTEQQPAQDYASGQMQVGNNHFIGKLGSASGYFDGIISHVHFCDGYAYAASDFGETDATTGEWKIKTSPSVSYGTKGFWILKDGNSLTDQSPNSNNWGANTGTLTKTEDNPSNSFCTINPLVNIDGSFTLSNGNTKFTPTGNNDGTFGTLAAIGGKFYYEVKYAAQVDTIYAGYAPVELANNEGTTNPIDSMIGQYRNTGLLQVGGSTDTAYTSVSAGDIFAFAIDLEASSGSRTVKAYKNGSLYGTVTIGTAYENDMWIPVCGDTSGGNAGRLEFNFGNGFFGTTAISSEGTNASGIGKFEYDVPAGYTALSTKGLNE